MASLEELRNERIEKLKKLQDKGINPYPVSVSCDETLADIHKNFDKLLSKKKELCVCGRILAIREHGGSVFVDIHDGTEKLQVYLKKDEIGEESFNLFLDTIDIGDFIDATGELFVTKKEEASLKASKWRIVSKSLRPLPDKWHGLSDVEERFRKRYLDILMDEEVKNRFIFRSLIIREIRNYLDDKNFLEVETPMLQPLPGGATAKPFKTHHNALDMELYLRIAPELYLKELLVAGFKKVYELGRNFRNEGIDVTHNPEFTSIEVYEAYSTPKEQMELIEELFKNVIKQVTGNFSIEHDGTTIDFSKFEHMTFAALMKKYALINESEFNNREELVKKAAQFNLKIEDFEGPEKILDAIYKKVARPKLTNPTFITDYPAAFSPLAKRKDGNPELIDRFQLIAGGFELVNGFSELNNPLEQEERFKEQEEKRTAGDEEAQKKDEEYITAMEYGMPPATGWAIGIDRLVMLLTDTKNIREVIIFPTLRPK